eukprot:TRINITY_DN8120_c0_g1_i1.p2 TRINITY_DN8120_c0_g1~~TRINITY_DN8120_c0_g1_i1.p2  ORF type:complete len:361 (+),score=194.74 TRINITY_DN8120_c0_g1_i1:53-1135(+)
MALKPAAKITDVLNQPRDSPLDNSDKVSFSFEFFPPKTDSGVKNLEARLGRMRGMNPEFIDFTWGAGGSTSTLTQELVKNAQVNNNYISNMHLTCTNMEKGMVQQALEEAKANGIRNIVALRGDPPAGQTDWVATDTGFTCALDLVKYIRENYGDFFCISVAGYPEGHPDKIENYEEYLKAGKIPEDVYKAEMDYLKAKIDAGADIIITQMFYDAQTFLNFVKDCHKWGIPESIPILPGLLPIQAYGGFRRMTNMCKTFIPAELEAEISAIAPADGLEGDEKKAAEEKVRQFGINHMTTMCKTLIAAGVKHLHFYCLNIDGPTKKILQNLGYVAQEYNDETQAEYKKKSPSHRGFYSESS